MANVDIVALHQIEQNIMEAAASNKYLLTHSNIPEHHPVIQNVPPFSSDPKCRSKPQECNLALQLSMGRLPPAIVHTHYCK
jgi:hypothetical protein